MRTIFAGNALLIWEKGLMETEEKLNHSNLVIKEWEGQDCDHDDFEEHRHKCKNKC
jgi:hypothetical protein